MKTEYVTLGVGPVFEEMAQLAAQLFTKVNGLPVRVITSKDLPSDLQHPAWGKAYIWDLVDADTERVLYFDADIVSLKPIGDLPTGQFVASEDGGVQAFIAPSMYQSGIILPGLDLNDYFNSGVFVCTRDTRPVFEELKTYPYSPEKYGVCFEQNMFNVLVKKHLGHWERLPFGFVNRVFQHSFDTRLVKLLHLPGIADKKYILSRLNRELETPPKKITVYAISKNEEKYVDKFMRSVQEADEVIILDTGSTDKTVELFKAWGATVHETKFEPWATLDEYDLLVAEGKKPFRFDTARNMVLDLVPENTDICVSLDIDEVLPADWRTKLEAAWTGDTNRVRYLFGWKMDKQDKPEIFFTYAKIHSRQGYEWRYPAHEYLFPKPSTVEHVKHLPDFTVKHYPDSTKCRSYYIHLLKLGVRENPESERAAYYYGRELVFTGEPEKGIAELKRYLLLPKATWAEERAKVCKFIANAYDALNKHDLVISWLLHGVAEQPAIRDNWVTLAETYYALKDYLGCYYAIRQALKIKECRAGHATHAKCWGYFPHELASVCAFQLGLKEQAALHLQNALIYSPNDPELLSKKEALVKYAEEKIPAIKVSHRKKSCLSTGIVEGVA
jgi:glycosyltransferase involved in cell wall biosynthesis